MSSSRAVVFANGDCNERILSLANISANDFVLCVDGGVRHCLQAQLRPDVVVGDLDSLDAASKLAIEIRQIECMRYPKDKDASDLQLGLELLLERSFDEVLLLGISGGRSDHSLFNWQLAASRTWPFQLRLLDDSVFAYVVDVAHPLTLSTSPSIPTSIGTFIGTSIRTSIQEGQVFSVIPVAHDAQGVCVSGARYPLDAARLSVGSTLGLSNEVTESRLQVSVDAGIVLVMLVHQET